MKIIGLIPQNEQSKNVVRDLIYGCWCKGKRIAKTRFPPMNMLLILTILKNEGHKVRLIDADSEGINLKELKEISTDFDAVIVSTATMTFNEDLKVCSELKKKNSKLIIIFYGQHVTIFPRQSLKNKGVDFIVKKEPEYIIKELVNTLSNKQSYKKLKGIGYKQKNKIIINNNRGFIKNLDELPFPDRKLLSGVDYFNPLAKRYPFTTITTSKGCPARCVFCTSPLFYGRIYRFRSPKNIFEELKLIKSLGYKEVLFRDETFTINKKRVRELCRLLIKNKTDLTWMCNARAGTIDKPLMKLMKKAGCHKIKFGVESGNQKILDNIKKDVKIEWIEKNFKEAEEIGMNTHAHLMIGSPGETKETIKNTIKFIKKIKPDTISVGILTPYPGTKLFNDIAKKDKSIIKNCTNQDLSKLHTKTFYNQLICKIDNKSLEDYVKKFYRHFYLRPSYLFWKLKKIKSLGEFKRVVKAGVTTTLFSLGGD